MIRFTSVADAKFSAQFKERVLHVYSMFPELQDSAITCGFIRRGTHITGTARSWKKQISLQPNVGNMTIAHELTHLLQGNAVPHGEKACDIWAVARLPGELLDGQPPYYILRHWQNDRWLRNRPAVKELCVQAIRVRESRRTYIKWLSNELRQLH